MRTAAVLVMAAAAACSPNDTVPDGGRHIDAPPVVAVDARVDAPAAPVPDTGPPPPPPTALLPDAPFPSVFMWPSVQEKFHANGMPCTGQVTVAVGDRAVCFVGADDDVHCAGAVYTHSWGPQFVAIGMTGVDQIVFSPTSGTTGNSMCVHKRAGTVWCMGDGNAQGQFGDGTTSPSATFVQFGSSTALARLGMDWRTRCALDTSGNIYCAGAQVSSATPVKQPGTNHVSFWTASDGTLHVDDPMVLRQTNGGPCEVEPDAVHCSAPQAPMMAGLAGMIVDATISAPVTTNGVELVCWLDPTGRVTCANGMLMFPEFATAPPLVALAGNITTDARCAVGDDGSLWCLGANTHGELGTGTTAPVIVETQVAPPGTVKVTCH